MYQRISSFDQIELQKSDTLTKTDLKDIKKDFESKQKYLYSFPSSSCHYGFTSPNGLQSFSYYCHSAFGGHYQKAESSRGFYDIQTRNLRPKINKAFMDFILDPKESPWKAGLEHISVVSDDSKIKDLPVLVILRNTRDTPIKVFMNAMVAGRLKPSWGLDYVWYNFCNSGFSKHTAMILSTLFSWDGQTLTVGDNPGKRNLSENPSGILAKRPPAMSDQPFYTLQGMFLNDFIQCKPSFKDSETLLNETEPQPCSVIWNRSRKTKDKMYYLDYKHCHLDPTKFLGLTESQNTRGILDCAWKGTKMPQKDVQEIEDAFRSETYIEV